MTPTVNPSLSLNLVADLRDLFQFPFMVHALEAATIVAVLASVVGWYVVLRRQAFAGHTLSVMAFPGAAGAALAGWPAALGYYVACAAAALAMAGTGPAVGRHKSVASAVIATVQVTGLAAGFLFLSLNHQILVGLETLLFGTFLGVSSSQVLVLLAIAAGVLAVTALIARPLHFCTLDPEVARARGVPVRALDVCFLLILAFAVAATSQITGALLTFALLVAPPAAAQLITGRTLAGLVVSVAIALVVAWLGLAAAYFSIYPAGFYVTTFALAAYVLAWTARAARGRLAARRRTRLPSAGVLESG
ncbi:MAG: metal ABC transporter permease [Solirubrobacterales bacterium]|nr:metal ABC transporter permease [Solirubrobacterales bacterium]